LWVGVGGFWLSGCRKEKKGRGRGVVARPQVLGVFGGSSKGKEGKERSWIEG